MLSDNGAGPALEVLRPIVAEEPNNHEALILTARAVMQDDVGQAAAMVDPVTLGSPHYDEAEAIRALASMFARAEDPGNLPEGPVKGAYVQAFGSARSGDFEAALEGLIDVVRRDRRYDDDGARKGCIAIFNLLGNEHELTRKFRSALSRALY